MAMRANANCVNLRKHIRCVQCVANPIVEDSPPPEPPARAVRRCYSIANYSAVKTPSMPYPQLHDISTKMENLIPFNCGHCGKLPIMPQTLNCGHTSCEQCLGKHHKCRCGKPYVPGHGLNILVSNLIDATQNPILVDQPKNWLSTYSAREWSEFPLPVPQPRLEDGAAIDEEVANFLLADEEQGCPLCAQLQQPRIEDGAAINEEVAKRWLSEEELDCPLCAHQYSRPITTPCGHTFCRTCLERTLDFNAVCPLCKMPLHWFDIELISETEFVTAALAKAGIPEVRDEEERRLPIFACTIAYPMVSCPLFVFEPRYRLMLRRCLLGNRRFGMVVAGPNKRFADYGTLLEIHDCVRLPNGCSLVSTVGVSRFRILERGERDGYAVARVEGVRDCDTSPLSEQKELLEQVMPLFLEWRAGIDEEDNLAIDATFGPMPSIDQWTDTDGPAFVWWATAFLPLPDSLKYSMLKKTEVMERVAMLQHCFLTILKQNSHPRIDNDDPAIGLTNGIDITD